MNGGDRGLLGNLSHALTLTVPVCRVLFGSPCIDSVCYPVSLQLCVCVCVCVCVLGEGGIGWMISCLFVFLFCQSFYCFQS